MAPCEYLVYLSRVVPQAGSLHSPKLLSACCALLEVHTLHLHYHTGHCCGTMLAGLLQNRPGSEMFSNYLSLSHIVKLIILATRAWQLISEKCWWLFRAVN